MARLDTTLNSAFSYVNDSEEAYIYEENNVNSHKFKNLAEEDIYNGRIADEFKLGGLRKKRDKKKKKTCEETRKIINRKVVNLPASQPYIKLVDGEERLCFKYNTKVSESALSTMPKAELEENEFCVRFDLDSVDISKLNEKFKAENCIYPRANIPYEMYIGNRWSYETECNRLAWQFVSLNPVLLYGKKGLIQRAVDSFRNFSKTNKGQRPYKEETFYGDIEKRRHIPPSVSSVFIVWSSRGTTKKCKIQVSVENVDYSKISDEFKSKYSVLDDVFDENSFGLEHWESKNEDNELAVKIAFLNVENTSFLNAIKAVGVHTVLKKAVDAYKHKKDEIGSSSDDVGAQDVVNSVLDQAFNSVNFNDNMDVKQKFF